jgi:hypothetical protein
MDTIRVLRVLEYVGPRHIIEAHLERCVHGIKCIHDIIGEEANVRAATIGITADILEMGMIEEMLPSVAQSKTS